MKNCNFQHYVMTHNLNTESKFDQVGPPAKSFHNVLPKFQKNPKKLNHWGIFLQKHFSLKNLKNYLCEISNHFCFPLKWLYIAYICILFHIFNFVFHFPWMLRAEFLEPHSEKFVELSIVIWFVWCFFKVMKGFLVTQSEISIVICI